MEKNYSSEIEQAFDSVKQIVLEKNKRYGNSALEPINIFCKLNSSEGITQRLDDKLMRIKNSNELRRNDIIDLMGYLGLYLVSQNWLDNKDLID